MLQNYKTHHLKKGKEKNCEKLEKMPGKGKYLLQSCQGGYANIELFLILTLAVESIAYQQKLLCKVLPILANSNDPGKFVNSFF